MVTAATFNGYVILYFTRILAKMQTSLQAIVGDARGGLTISALDCTALPNLSFVRDEMMLKGCLSPTIEVFIDIITWMENNLN